MKNGSAILLIILGLFALWAYNTGRAQAILGVIKDPNYKPQTTASQIGVATSGNPKGGSSNCSQQSGFPSMDCIFQDISGIAGSVIPGVGTIPVIGDILGGVGDLFGGLF